MVLKLHLIMQDAADFHDIGFGPPVEKKVTRIADPAPALARFLAAVKKVIGSAVLGDFRSRDTARKFGIGRYFLDRCLDELGVTVQ